MFWLQGGVDFANLDVLASSFGVPAGVVHLAGGATVGASLRSPTEDFDRTCVSSAHLLDWVRQRSPQTKVLVVSSAAVYGSGHEGPIAEGDRLDPGSPYGCHKLVMELLCRSYARSFGVSIMLLRLFSVYGEGLQKQLLWDLCSKLARSRDAQLGGTGREVRDWLHASDAAKLIGMALPLASPDCPAINGGSGIGTSVADIANVLAARWGDGARVEFSGTMRAGDPAVLVAKIDRAAAIGFRPGVALVDGLHRYVDWFREHTDYAEGPLDAKLSNPSLPGPGTR
jgi:UDP-glucose 4-epimerase